MNPESARLRIRPEIIEKIRSGGGALWHPAHGDGSDNRINEDAIADSATVSFSLAFLTAGVLWARKAFRNRKKTRQDLAAEKEAAKIQKTIAAAEERLLAYIRQAREGAVTGETLDDLIDVMEEMHAVHQTGKLIVADREALAEIRTSVQNYTDALAESKAAPAVPAQGEDDFERIRNLLIRQKQLTA